MSEAANEETEHRVLLVYGNDTISSRLSLILENIRGVRIVEVMNDTDECLAKLTQITPDLVVTDDALPTIDALLIARRAKALSVPVRVMIFAAIAKESRLLATLAAGVDAYCLTSASPSKLMNAAEAVLKGAFWLDEYIAPTIKNVAVRAGASTFAQGVEKHTIGVDDLSNRQLEVLALLALGQTNAQIAQNLFISRETVKTHVKAIMKKLAVQHRTQAAVEALKRNIVL